MALSKSATALRRVIKAAVTPAKLPRPWSTLHRATLGLERFAPTRLRKTVRRLAYWKNPALKNAAKRSTLKPMLRSGAGKTGFIPTGVKNLSVAATVTLKKLGDARICVRFFGLLRICPAPPSHLEPFAEIELPADRIVDEKILRAFAFDPAFVNQIGAVHDRQCLAHVMIGD